MTSPDNRFIPGVPVPGGSEETPDAFGGAQSPASAESFAPPTEVRMSKKAAFQTFHRFHGEFESALRAKNYARAVEVFKMADKFEAEVMKPNGLTTMVRNLAQHHYENGDKVSAESMEESTIDGLRRKAIEYNFNLPEHLSKATPEGILANFPSVERPDAEKISQYRLGAYTADRYFDAPVVAEKARLLQRFGDDPDTLQSTFRRLEEGHAMLESLFSGVGTAAERARVAPDLGRLAFATDTDFAIVGPSMQSLVNVFQAVESIEEPGEGLAGAPSRSKERVLESAVSTLAFVHKEAPAYAPDVMRMFANGFVDEREIATGMTPAALAHRLVLLAPAVRAVEEAAAVYFPGNEPEQKTARADYTRTMLRGIANDKGIGLYEPNAAADQKAMRLIENTTVLSVDPGDPTAAIAVAAQATGLEPSVVIRQQVDQAVKSRRLTPEQGVEVTSAMQTISAAESDSRVKDVYQVVKDTDTTAHPFSDLVAELQIPGSDPHNPQRKAAAVAIDSVRSKGRPAAGGPPVPFGSIDEALAAAAGLPSDAAASDEFAVRSKFGQARRGYDAIWEAVYSSAFPDTSRDFEAARRDISGKIAAFGALFTNEDALDAKRRDFLEGSTKIGAATIKHADLVQNEAELDYLIGQTDEHPDGVPELRAADSAAERFRAFADRALMQGWLVYDPGKGTLAINSKVDPKSFRVKGGGDTEVTFDAPWIAPDMKITVDAFDPEGVATAMGAITFQSNIEDPAARVAEWSRRAASLASVGGTVRNLDGSMAALRQYGPELRQMAGGSSAAGGPVLDLVQMLSNRVVDHFGAGGQRGRSRLQEAEAAKQKAVVDLNLARAKAKYEAEAAAKQGLSPTTLANTAARLAAADAAAGGGSSTALFPGAVEAVRNAVAPPESEEDDEDGGAVLLPRQMSVLE